MDYTTKANQLKRKQVEEIISLIKEYPIVGTVNVAGLPTPQLQTMRSKLRDTVVLRVGKKNLFKLALEECTKDKESLAELIPYIEGMPALLFTKGNPFSLFKILKNNKSTAPAKAGQVAPKDIVVNAGSTSFAPGPIIGELGAFGIKTSVEGGKLKIKQDAVVAKKGATVSASLAGILSRLGIEPMEVGLDLTAVYEDGMIYSKSVLDVDEDKLRAEAELFAQQAYNLAINANIIVPDTVQPLIGIAASGAKALAIEIGFLTKETIGMILAKAESHAKCLDTLNK